MDRSNINGRLEDASPAKARQLSDVPYNFESAFPAILMPPQTGFRLTLGNLAAVHQSSVMFDALADDAVREYRAGKTKSLRESGRKQGKSRGQ